MIAITESLADVPCTGAHVWPLRITATAGEGEDSKVFVYKREQTLYTEDVFWKVASVDELTSIPADTPAPDDLFFRTDVVLFHARNVDEAGTVLQNMLYEVDLLNADLIVLADLATEEHITEMITLTKHTVENTTVEGQHVWPLRIVAVSSDNAVSDKIFVFHASDGDDMYEGDVFEAVASIQQMNELPADAAGFDTNGEMCPYFRSSTLTFYTRSPAEADNLWNDIVEDVDDLVRNLSVATDTQVTHSSTGD